MQAYFASERAHFEQASAILEEAWGETKGRPMEWVLGHFF